MEELYTPHEGMEVCVICGNDVENPAEALKFVDPNNQEEFFFDKPECHKEFTENPELYTEVESDEEIE